MKIEEIENELNSTKERAKLAENELVKQQKQHLEMRLSGGGLGGLSFGNSENLIVTAEQCLNCKCNLVNSGNLIRKVLPVMAAAAPPPPPPPLPPPPPPPSANSSSLYPKLKGNTLNKTNSPSGCNSNQAISGSARDAEGNDPSDTVSNDAKDMGMGTFSDAIAQRKLNHSHSLHKHGIKATGR